jgi:hypothetical protein
MKTTNLLNLVREVVEEKKNWSKMMKGVDKGSQKGPWTIIASRGSKVISQKIIKTKDSIPAHFQDIKKDNKGKADKIYIEDDGGEVVYNEKY